MYTIKDNSKYELIIKNSKFIALLYKITDANIDNILNKLRMDYPDATHYCYAYIYDDVKIGRDTVIHPNTTIKSGVVIGENCEIGPNVFNPEFEVFRGFWMLSWFIEQFGAADKEAAARRGSSTEQGLDEKILEIEPGCGGLLLRTAVNNVPAQRLYEKCGFLRLGTHPSGELLYLKRFSHTEDRI